MLSRRRAALSRVPIFGLASAAIVAVVALLVLLPTASIFYGSLRSEADQASLTLQNWATVYVGPSYLGPFLNTVILSVLVASICVVLGTGMAWIVARTDAPGRRALGLLLYLPVMVSPLITALAWVALAAPAAGFLNAAFHAAFPSVQTIFNIYSLPGVVFVMVLHYAPYAYLAAYVAMRGLDASLEDASYVLGAGPLTTARKMTLPLITPALASGALLTFVFVAENFSVPTMLGTPVGYNTLPSSLYFDLNVAPTHAGLAAAAGTMLLALGLLGTVVQRRLTARGRRYVTIGGKGGRPRFVRLGPLRYLASGLCVLYLVLAIFLPYAALVAGSFMQYVTSTITPTLFTTSNYTELVSSQYLSPIENTLLLSVVGGLAASLFYVVVSYFVVRARARTRVVLDYLTIAPTAIPAMVLAIGLLWAFVSLPLPIYGTLWILALAYITKYLGYGVRQTTSSMMQISAELEEAARVSGAGALRAFRDVVFPIVRPAFLSLWMLLLILFSVEVSSTILLYSPNTETATVLLWNQLANGATTTAFAIAVLQATAVFGILLLLNRVFGTAWMQGGE